jgi:hypothetical protein
MQSQNQFPEPNWHMLDFLHPILLHIPSTAGDALSLSPILSFFFLFLFFFFQNLELAVQGPILLVILRFGAHDSDVCYVVRQVSTHS